MRHTQETKNQVKQFVDAETLQDFYALANSKPETDDGFSDYERSDGSHILLENMWTRRFGYHH